MRSHITGLNKGLVVAPKSGKSQLLPDLVAHKP